MDNLFFILYFFSLLVIIVGLIKPGIVVRWGEKRGRRQVFKYYGIAFIIFFTLFIIVTPDTENTNSGSEQMLNTNAQSSYDIITVNDFSYVNTKRYNYDVVVTGKPGPDQLKIIAKEVIEKAKKDKKFNAVSVSMYDNEEYIGYGYTLGKVIFSYNGDWGQADKAIVGDYDVMEYSYDIRNKNWDKQLTKKEVEIWSYCEKYKEEKNMESDEAYELAAKKFDITAEDVKNIMFKRVFWANDNQE